MKKIIGLLWTIFAYFCIATVLAELNLAAYVIFGWKLDGDRMTHIIAIAQGKELPATTNETVEEKKTETPEQQGSFDQVLEARATKYRDLELREQQLSNNLNQLQYDQTKLADDKKKYKQVHDSFENQLATLESTATAAGEDEVRNILEKLKPKQAKEYVLQMIDNKEDNAVVTLLSAMAEDKRAKIIGEFKNADEMQKTSEIFRRIREGKPKADLADNTKKQLQPSKTAAP